MCLFLLEVPSRYVVQTKYLCFYHYKLQSFCTLYSIKLASCLLNETNKENSNSYAKRRQSLQNENTASLQANSPLLPILRRRRSPPNPMPPPGCCCRKRRSRPGRWSRRRRRPPGAAKARKKKDLSTIESPSVKCQLRFPLSTRRCSGARSS